MGENEFVVFLDIDGVLNKESDWNKKYYVDNNCISCLKQILQLIGKKYTPKVVLTSTWRAGMNGTVESKQIMELKSKLAAYGIEIADATPVSNHGRQREVMYYIRKNEVLHYIVIDDDESLFDDIGQLNFYKPNYKTGLTTQDVRRIKKMI